MVKKLYGYLKQEIILSILFFLFIILTTAMPGYIEHYHEFVDWKTIATLIVLIITATGIKDSAYLDRMALSILVKIKDERTLMFFLTLLSLILSMFLTNDITLFIIVPLTLSMQDILKQDMAKAVIFESIAVNTGSALTPIGNPQNIFLWNSSGISFVNFVLQMLPIFLIMTVILFIFVCIYFKNQKLIIDSALKIKPVKQKLAIFSVIIMSLFLIALQFKMELYILPFVVIFYIILNRNVLKNTDWFLIITFIFMFIDFSLISKIPFVESLVRKVLVDNNHNIFVLSAVVSQFMSNVPGAIFVSKFSSNWKAIAYGVSIAGNGLIIGSLANIIAIRLLKSKDTMIWFEFHKISIPYFIITFFAVIFMII